MIDNLKFVKVKKGRKPQPGHNQQYLITTPPGTALFPHLTYYDDKPIKGKPQKPAYKVTLALEGDAAPCVDMHQDSGEQQ